MHLNRKRNVMELGMGWDWVSYFYIRWDWDSKFCEFSPLVESSANNIDVQLL